MLLLQQMIILFLLMMVGFGLKKNGLINATGVKTLSAVVVNAANPAMVLAASINKENTIQGMELARTFGLILIVYVILIINRLDHIAICRERKVNSARSAPHVAAELTFRARQIS